MRTFALVSTLALGLLLAACGGDDGGGGNGPADKAPEKVSDPWEGVGFGSLTGDVTERLRELSFADGVTVSYDGGAESGDEEVCRRQKSGDTWYRVCMPLEDDPWFVPLPHSALVWHPLMFDRFATELRCHSWPEPGEDEAPSITDEICDTDFFGRMGGEGFVCHAGPVNGDKALVCSDHWAVAVNGREEDTKAVCRVHTESGSGRCLGARKPGMESDAALLVQMQRTAWEGYQSQPGQPRPVRSGGHRPVGDSPGYPTGGALLIRFRGREPLRRGWGRCDGCPGRDSPHLLQNLPDGGSPRPRRPGDLRGVAHPARERRRLGRLHPKEQLFLSG